MHQHGDRQGDESVSSSAPTPLVPVSAEDFASRRRRIVAVSIGAGVLVLLLALWGYRRSVDPLEARRSLEEGQRLLQASRYSEAILSFDHAVGLKGDLADAYLLRGRARAALTQLEPAIEDFSRAIRLRPGNAEAFLERASAHLAQQDFKAAVADCGEALTLDSGLAMAYSLRAAALRQTGNTQAALGDLNRAVELAPDETNYFQRAAGYQLLGQHKLALADLDQVITLRPDGPQAYFARAQSRRATGDRAGADQDYRKGLQLDGR